MPHGHTGERAQTDALLLRCGIILFAALWALCRYRHNIHSTGHESRLNRKELLAYDEFGGENYSKEELTAELAAVFISAVTDIQQETLANSTAYIKGWLQALKNDKRLILTAASQAQKAADYILCIESSDKKPG